MSPSSLGDVLREILVEDKRPTADAIAKLVRDVLIEGKNEQLEDNKLHRESTALLTAAMTHKLGELAVTAQHSSKELRRERRAARDMLKEVIEKDIHTITYTYVHTGH